MTNKEMFKANMQIVEIEPHSYCNRKCWFCPNSFIDRTGPNIDLNPDVYEMLLRDLASINYDETVCFAGWCEPFSRLTTYLQLVQQAREALPDACIITNTNGDFLNEWSATKAANAGLDVVKAQLYFGENEEICEEAIREKAKKLQEKLGSIQLEEMSPLNWFALVEGKMLINAYARNFREMGVNRCDMKFVKEGRRMALCLLPIHAIGVNHNGMVVPCCNIRGDYEPHKPYLLGKMIGVPGEIFEYYKPALLDWREYPCKTCMFKQVGKMQHANIKLMYRSIIEDMKWRIQLAKHSLPQSEQEQPVPQTQF